MFRGSQKQFLIRALYRIGMFSECCTEHILANCKKPHYGSLVPDFALRTKFRISATQKAKTEKFLSQKKNHLSPRTQIMTVLVAKIHESQSLKILFTLPIRQ